MSELCVGLFGTCGGSRWRDPFIAAYEREGIAYFNPQVDDWKPELALDEARHLAEDPLILFPVTSETYGLGSLAEVGFSILNAIRIDCDRDFVVLIDQTLDEALDDLKLRKESLRGRALVLAHLRKLRLARAYLVDSMEQMLDVSLTLARAAELRQSIAHLSTAALDV